MNLSDNKEHKDTIITKASVVLHQHLAMELLLLGLSLKVLDPESLLFPRFFSPLLRKKQALQLTTVQIEEGESVCKHLLHLEIHILRSCAVAVLCLTQILDEESKPHHMSKILKFKVHFLFVIAIKEIG